MQVSLFAFVSIAFIGYLCIKCKKLTEIIRAVFNFYIILSLTVDYGFSVAIGSIQLSHTAMTSIVLFVLCLIYLFQQKKCEQKTFIIGLAWITAIGVGALLYEIWPYEGRFLAELAGWDRFLTGKVVPLTDRSVRIGTFAMNYFAAFRFVTILTAMKMIFRDQSKLVNSFQTVSQCVIFNIIYGFIELVAKNVLWFDISSKFLTPILGVRESAYQALSQRNGIFVLQGLTSEPSFYSFNLFVCGTLFLLMIFTIKNGVLSGNYKKYRLCFIGTTILELLTMSFSGYVFVICLLVLYYFCSGHKVNIIKIIKYIGATACIIVAILMVDNLFLDKKVMGYLDERIRLLLKTIVQIQGIGVMQANNSSSEAVRLTSIIESLKIVFVRPFFGLYWGASDCHSCIVSVLVNGGFVITGLWAAFVWNLMKPHIRMNLFTGMLICVLMILGSFGDAINLSLVYCLWIWSFLNRKNILQSREG